MKRLFARFARREFCLLVVLGVIGIAGPAAALTLLPSVKNGKALTVQRDELRNDASDLDQLRSLLRAIETETTRLDAAINGDMSDLPDRELEAYIIGRLQRISWSNEVRLAAIRPWRASRSKVFASCCSKSTSRETTSICSAG